MKEESKRRLNEISEMLPVVHLSDANIDKMESLIHECHRIAVQEKLVVFTNDLSQTINEQLYILLKVKNKPRKRYDAWQEFMKYFMEAFEFVDIAD